jgi:hypothetical protein
MLLQAAAPAANTPGVAVMAGLEARGAQGSREVLSMAEAIQRSLAASMPEVMPVKELQRRLGTPETNGAGCAGLRKAYRQAFNQAYEFKKEQAQKALESVVGKLRRCPGNSEQWALWVDSQVLLAKVRSELSDKTGALAAFSEVLRARPDLKLSSADHSPAIRSLLEEAKELPVSRSTLSIATRPEGAVVQIDGVKVGITPYRNTHPTGEYRLTLAQGPLSIERQVRLGASGAMLDLDLALEVALEAYPFPALIGKERLWSALGRRLEVGQLAIVERRQEHWRVTLVDLSTGEVVRAGWVKKNEKEAGKIAARFLATGDLQNGKVLLNLAVPAFYAPGTIGEAKTESGT